MTTKTLSLLTLALMLAVSSLNAQEPKKAKKLPDYWQQDFAAAQAAAKTSGKTLMVVFSTSWCPPCQELVKNVYPKPEVKAALEPYVCVYVDGDKHEDLVKKFKIEAYPSFVFLDTAGKELRRRAGVATSVQGFLSFVNGGSKPKATDVVQEEAKIESESAKNPDSAAASQPEPEAVAALDSLGKTHWRMVGKAKIKSAPSGGGMGFMVVGGAAPGGTPFKGDFHFEKSDQGDILFASAGKLPSVEIYRRGKDTLTRTTVANGKTIDEAQLSADLRVLLKMDGLMKWAHTASKWTVANDEAQGTKTFSATLPKNLFDSNRPSEEAEGMGMMMMMDPMAVKIIGGTIAVTTAQDGSLSGLSLSIIRNDPMAAMQELMEDQGDEGEGIDIMALQDMEPVPGEAHHYHFSASQAPTPARISKLFFDFREMLK